MKIYPVILSGGSGTRLWPLSKKAFPKQFLQLTSDNSMFQETYLRLKGLDIESPIVVCNIEHRFIVAEQLNELNINNSSIILEPIGKNTAPAIAIAAFKAIQQDKDAILIVLPSDHIVNDINKFQEAVKNACSEARNNTLLTFGIKPTHPETGYGYIEANKSINESIYQIIKFVEKPNLEKARQYVDSENFFWNSGMFVFKAETYLNELEKNNQQMLNLAKLSFDNAVIDNDFIRINKDYFEQINANSIDYEIMEKTSNGKLIPLDAGWNDLGSWSAIWDNNFKDENKNVIIGDVQALETSNSYINSQSKFVATIGIKDTIIVDTKEALLIADKKDVQKVKIIVDELIKQKKTIATENAKGFRPWGFYEIIEKGLNYKVKLITVKPQGKLSLQMHHHRAEHWVVVSGTAKVTNGDKEFLLSENESTFIPLGVIHSLENPGKIPLELIEVQSGNYLEEDDIIRFDDKYGR